MMSNFEMTDISPLLVFSFWQPVYVLKDKKERTFPSKSTKVRGRFVGISEHIGHAMTFQILLDDTKKIVHRSIVRSALDPDLLNLRLKQDHPGDLHPTVQAELLLDKENKQCDRFLANVQKRQEQELLNHVHVRLDQDLSRNDSKPLLSIDDDDFDKDTSPNFVFLRDDGEFENSSVHRDKRKKLANPFKTDPNDLHPTEKPAWKEFEVPLLDKNGEPRMDDDKNPITFIAKDPTSLHSTTFLMKPDEHGEQQRARVTEIIGDWEKQLKTQQDREEFLRNLQYCVVYERPNHRQKPFDKDNPGDSAFDDLLTYNEVVGYINKEVTDETGEYWQFREILGFQHTPQGHKDRMGSKYNVKML